MSSERSAVHDLDWSANAWQAALVLFRALGAPPTEEDLKAANAKGLVVWGTAWPCGRVHAHWYVSGLTTASICLKGGHRYGLCVGVCLREYLAECALVYEECQRIFVVITAGARDAASPLSWLPAELLRRICRLVLTRP